MPNVKFRTGSGTAFPLAELLKGIQSFDDSVETHKQS